MDVTTNQSLPDMEMHSQTETEDTDGGDMIALSCSDLNSSAVDSASTSPGSSDKASAREDARLRSEILLAIEKSVDLTDVTELSNLEDFSAIGRKNSDANKLEDVETEMPKFDFDFTTGDWYNQKCFQRYWSHYHHAMAWCQKHYQMYYKLQQKYYKNFPQHTNGYCSSWQHPYRSEQKHLSQHHLSDMGSKSKSPRAHRRHRRRKRKADSSRGSSDTATQTSEEFEMEVTPEMLEFFAKSKKHKEQRDELKKAQNDAEEESKRINVEEVKVGAERIPTVEPPKRQAGSKRTEEMKLLYGKGAAMIHGMETAVQMTFDRNTDTKQPKLWPNMPLKIVFG